MLFRSPFPHGTRSLSVAERTLVLERGRPSFPRGYSSPVVLTNSTTRAHAFQYEAFTPYGQPFQAIPVNVRHHGEGFCAPSCKAVQPRAGIGRKPVKRRSVWTRPRSLATTTGLSVISSPRGT